MALSEDQIDQASAILVGDYRAVKESVGGKKPAREDHSEKIVSLILACGPRASIAEKLRTALPRVVNSDVLSTTVAEELSQPDIDRLMLAVKAKLNIKPPAKNGGG